MKCTKNLKNKLLKSLIIGAMLLTGCGDKPSSDVENTNTSGAIVINNDNKDNLANTGVIGDNITITRGEVARIIALSFYTNDEIAGLENVNKFKDIEDSEYRKYINACVKLGYIKDNDKYRPRDLLTINEAQSIANGISKNSVVLKFSKEEQKQPISYGLFVKAFIAVLENGDFLGDNNINYKNMVVLATKKNNEKLGSNILTDYGTIKISYVDYSEVLNSKIKALVRVNEIICAIETVDNQPLLEDVFVLQSEGDTLSVFVGGLTRQYTYESGFDKNYSGYLCDIQIEGNKLLDFKAHEKFVQGNIKLIDVEGSESKFVEIEGDKVLKFADFHQVKVFNAYNEKVRTGEFSDVVIGDDNVKFFVNEENLVVGCIVDDKPQKENIRVLINTSNFGSKYHSGVSVTSKKEFYVQNGDFNKTIKANEIYKVPKDSDNRIIIRPSENGELKLVGVKRHDGDASFKGNIEVKKLKDGFVVTNVVSIEEYLKRVVPSEMPSSYHKEALKAQAVTARSFAMKTLSQTSYKKYGSNLDDSTSSQVYNNVIEVDEVNMAIKETEGMILTYEGKAVSTNFYSTSSGFGANSGDVWGDLRNKAFPVYTPEYLSSKPLVSKKNTPTFESEEDVAKFLKSTKVSAVDSEYPWFRWKYEMTAEQLSKTINTNIKDRYSVNPFMIVTKVGDEYVEKEITSVGKVKDINVVSRGDGGILTCIEVVGSEKTVKIMGEYNIRYILKPVGYVGDTVTITKQDGSKSENYSLIPSAFFVFDKNKDGKGNLEGIKVYGGGSGHGVGMSQNGAEELAKHDIGYVDILKYFYSGVEVEVAE